MSLKTKIFEKLDKDGYITDQEVYNLENKEPSWCQVEVYKSLYFRLKGLRDFFKDKKIVSVNKIGRGYYAEVESGHSYKINKEYFDELNNKL